MHCARTRASRSFDFYRIITQHIYRRRISRGRLLRRRRRRRTARRHAD